MKGFIITVALSITLMVCIIINYNFVNKVHDTMHSMVEQLSNMPSNKNEEIIVSLKQYWDSKNTLLSFSVSFREIDDLSNKLDSMYAANQSGNTSQFLISKELLQNAIDAIMRLERFSVKNMF